MRPIAAILEKGRIFAVLPALAMFVGALGLGLFSVYLLCELIFKVATHPEYREPGLLAAQLLAVIDLNLLSVVMYLFSVGMYEIFVGQLDLPEGIKVESIYELKAKTASVVILVLAITFTKKAVAVADTLQLVYLSVAISLMIFALIFYIREKGR